MKIRALLVDDEYKALKILQNKIERCCPDLEIIGSISDPDLVANFIEENSPDLVFLDIAMPQKSGFDVLAELSSLDFELIFVTAFDEYALEAIEHSAIGYLLKPVNNEKLKKAVDNAAKNIESKSFLQKNKILLSNLSNNDEKNKKIVIPTTEGFNLIEIQKIAHIEGDEGYTHIHTIDGDQFFSSYRIGHFTKILENQNFCLIHRSHLINLRLVNKYLNEGYIVLENKERIPVSRSRRKKLKELLQQIY